MYRLIAVVVAALCLACSSDADTTSSKLAAPNAPAAAALTRTDDIPITVTTDKVRGQTIVTVTWDASLVRTDSVRMVRQNQSADDIGDPVFVHWTLANTGTFVDTLPKRRTTTAYYYWFCEYPAPEDTHCAVRWTPAL